MITYSPTAESPSEDNSACSPGSHPLLRSGTDDQWLELKSFFTEELVRHRAIFLILAHVIAFSGILLLAHAIRFDMAIPTEQWRTLEQTLPIVVVIKLGAFMLLKSHRGWWRAVTFTDVISLLEAATLGSITLVALLYFVPFDPPMPRSVLLLDWAGTILLLGGIRASTRVIRERYSPMMRARSQKRVLVVGASQTGMTLVREILAQPALGLRVVGFVDSNPNTRGRTLAGVSVLGTPEEVLANPARNGRFEIVLVPTPAVPAAEVRQILQQCRVAGIPVQVVPGFDALISGRVMVKPRDVDILDLLSRDPVRLDDTSLRTMIQGKTVLVTGAAGSIGSEICRQVLRFQPVRLLLIDHSENGLYDLERELIANWGSTRIIPKVASITDVARLRSIFQSHRPQLVFHAAAHKHVPMMEKNPGEAVKNNVFGTRTLVDVAVEANVEAFVMVSTDKAVRPTSVMGACKRLAEMYVQALHKSTGSRLVTVRFGNVMGSNGSVVPLFKEQIRNGGPVTVTDPEVTRYFMTIPEAAQLVLQAAAQGKGGEIFVLDMGVPIKIVDLAKDLIRLSGLEEGKDIKIEFTGLRPGEKLSEELYADNEENLATPHPKIFVAGPSLFDPEWLRNELARLAKVVNGSRVEILDALSDCVPEYQGRRGVTDVTLSNLPSPSLQPPSWDSPLTPPTSGPGFGVTAL